MHRLRPRFSWGCSARLYLCTTSAFLQCSTTFLVVGRQEGVDSTTACLCLTSSPVGTKIKTKLQSLSNLYVFIRDDTVSAFLTFIQKQKRQQQLLIRSHVLCLSGAGQASLWYIVCIACWFSPDTGHVVGFGLFQVKHCDYTLTRAVPQHHIVSGSAALTLCSV